MATWALVQSITSIPLHCQQNLTELLTSTKRGPALRERMVGDELNGTVAVDNKIFGLGLLWWPSGKDSVLPMQWI